MSGGIGFLRQKILLQALSTRCTYVKLLKYIYLHTIENTLFIGKVIQHFETIESTNAYAINLVSKSNPSEGTVISAYSQTHGRGQIGSKWQSEPGMNLTLSVILFPSFLQATQQFLLNQAIALGVYDFLSQLLPTDLTLKWPNDIYYKKRKLGGILLQSGLKGQQLLWCVAGIGINVNQTSFDKELPNPTSLQLIGHKNVEIVTLLPQLCQHLEFRYLQLRNGQHDKIKADYLQCCYRYMEEHLFERPSGEIFAGKITGVNPIGKLLITHQNGEEAFGMKEVRFV